MSQGVHELRSSPTPHTQLGHPGEDKFKRAVSTQFFWPKMSKDITTLLKTCKPCSEQKYNRGKAAGLLRSFPRPTNKWSEIAMDLMNRKGIRLSWHTLQPSFAGGRPHNPFFGCHTMPLLVEATTTHIFPTCRDLLQIRFS